MTRSRRSCGRLPSNPRPYLLVHLANGSSPHLDLSVRQYVLDLCRIIYVEKTSYMVTLKLPKKKKRFACHNLGKVSSTSYDVWLMRRARLLCGGSIRVIYLRNGKLNLLLLLHRWHRLHSNSRSSWKVWRGRNRWWSGGFVCNGVWGWLNVVIANWDGNGVSLFFSLLPISLNHSSTSVPLHLAVHDFGTKPEPRWSADQPTRPWWPSRTPHAAQLIVPRMWGAVTSIKASGDFVHTLVKQNAFCQTISRCRVFYAVYQSRFKRESTLHHAWSRD